jgi:hypothetical protein
MKKRGKCQNVQIGKKYPLWDGSREKKKVTLKILNLFSVTVEADDEMKESEKSRGIGDDEKTDRPSEVMSALDKGLSAITNLMADEFNM